MAGRVRRQSKRTLAAGTGAALGLIALVAAGPAETGPAEAGMAEVDRIELAVVDGGGAACPRDATLTAWAHTDGPGTVRFVIHNAGGGKTGALEAQAVAGAAGTYLATYRHSFKITTDTDTRYRAQAVGSDESSNWVPLKATCGPQPRSETAATGSTGRPPTRTASDSRAREAMGEATGGGNTPGAGAPPARGGSDSRPNSGGKPAGTSKPNSSSGKGGAGGKQCGSQISSTRLGAVTREGGKMTAQVGWMAAVQAEHSRSWAEWANAKDRSLSCKRAGLLWTCKASARPCEP